MSLILDGTNGLSDVDGTAAAPAIRGTDTNTGIFFPAADTIAFSEGGAEAMRITSTGDVGIGTSSPAGKLHVEGGSENAIIGSSTRKIYFRADSGGIGLLDGAVQTGNGFYVNGASSYVATFTGSTERMRINSSGNLLVGTTALISGFSAISTIVSATNALSNITLKDTGTTYGTGTQYISFVNSSNAGAGSIQHTAVTTVAYATTSDLRLKENITDCPSALNIAQQIKVRSYNWKEDGRRVDYGFVAQELNPFFPDAVCQGDDSEEILDPKQTWQVDYGKITPLLLKAIQEQQALITALTTRITALEAA